MFLSCEGRFRFFGDGLFSVLEVIISSYICISILINLHLQNDRNTLVWEKETWFCYSGCYLESNVYGGRIVKDVLLKSKNIGKFVLNLLDVWFQSLRSFKKTSQWFFKVFKLTKWQKCHMVLLLRELSIWNVRYFIDFHIVDGFG